jgi:mono/diheme cytochrome c family protein
MNSPTRLVSVAITALLAAAAVCLLATARAEPEGDARLAARAQAVLRQYCFQCHGGERTEKKLKILDHQLLLAKETSNKKHKILAAGKPDESELIRRIESKDNPMPPEGEERPADADVKALRDWIAAGAPAFPDVKPVVTTATAPTNLASEVKEIFRKNCQECHGGRFTYADLKILDFAALLKDGHAVPGKPDESPIFQRITARDGTVMPKKPNPPLRPEEIAKVRQWIISGAAEAPADVTLPAAAAPEDKLEQQAVGVGYVLRTILKDVRDQRKAGKDVSVLRYFTLTHLLTRGVTRRELDLQRDALTVAINHLSWQPRLVTPRVVDAPTNTIFSVDLRDLGWDKRPFRVVQADGQGKLQDAGASPRNLFDLVLAEYPYAAMYDSRTYEALAGEFLVPAGQVRPIPYVRADWFVSTATLPPLYEDLLQLPATLPELEQMLGVDTANNRRRFVAGRAGMTVSGVSNNNRVVERHPLPRGTTVNGVRLDFYGYFWISFDYKSSKGQDNMFRDPIDLKPAGGEMIFSLPNGLQGYYVANGKGDRVEAAPTEIVKDDFFAADKIVRNGLSCIRCHDKGMKGFADTVRPAVALLPDKPGFDRRAVLDLYPGDDVLGPKRDQDGQVFLKAMKGLLGKQPPASPLGPVTRDFSDTPLKLTDASAELGYPQPEGLAVVFRQPQFASLGLTALGAENKAGTNLGLIRRDMWDDYFDQVVRMQGLGTPVVPLDSQVRLDHKPTPEPFTVEFRTNKKNNTFEVGDRMVFFIKPSKDVHVELVATSVKGRKSVWVPPTLVKAGQEFRFPPAGQAIEVRGQLGKEQYTLFAAPENFPAGEVLRGTGVTDRVLHPFYELRRDSNDRVRPTFDPAAMVKKTIEIETR